MLLNGVQSIEQAVCRDGKKQKEEISGCFSMNLTLILHRSYKYGVAVNSLPSDVELAEASIQFLLAGEAT